jgi:AraC-like DNA-binding protein
MKKVKENSSQTKHPVMTESKIITITVPSFDSESNLTITNLNQETPETQVLTLEAPAFSGFCFSLTGEVEVTLDNTTIRVKKRTYQFIATPGGAVTVTLSPGNHALLLIQLPQDFIELFRDSLPDAFDKVLSAISAQQSYCCFRQARRTPYEMFKTVEEIRNFKATSKEFTHAFYYNKIVSLLFQHIQNLLQPEEPIRTRSCSTDIAMAEHLLKKEYKKSWTLDLLAETVGIHKRKLTDLFRQLLGTSPMEYLIDFRLQKAFDLLMNTSLSITAITRKAGYTHIQAFTRAFHRKYGHAPTKYRKHSGEMNGHGAERYSRA